MRVPRGEAATLHYLSEDRCWMCAGVGVVPRKNLGERTCLCVWKRIGLIVIERFIRIRAECNTVTRLNTMTLETLHHGGWSSGPAWIDWLVDVENAGKKHVEPIYRERMKQLLAGDQPKYVDRFAIASFGQLVQGNRFMLWPIARYMSARTAAIPTQADKYHPRPSWRAV